MDKVIVIEVGKQGPAGSGVTAPAWNELNGKVTSLLNPPTSPSVAGAARSLAFITNSTVPVVFGESIIQFPAPVATKATVVKAWCSADITTPGGTIAYMAVTIGTGTYIGTYYETPSGAGTVPAIAGLGITFPPGVLSSAFTVRPIVYLSTAANGTVTFANVRVWAESEQLG